MRVIVTMCTALGQLNGAVFMLGRWLGAICMAGMVIAILLQVFFRYALGSALAWPEETSRFLMLWSTGLMAATAFRRGGFVAIDMVMRMLPPRIVALVVCLMLCLSGLVLWIGVGIAWSEVTGIGGRFQTDSLYLPASFDLQSWFKVPKSWMMTSMLVGVVLLLMANVELFLRNLAVLLGGGDDLPEIPETVVMGAE